MIYFVQRASDGCIKIGTTIRLSQRLAALRAAYGSCGVLGVADGSYADESALHRRFGGSLAEGREWFYDDAAIRDFIAIECRPWDGEDESPFFDIRLQMPGELHKRIAEAAGEDGNSVAAFIRTAVVEKIERRERERGGKT